MSEYTPGLNLATLMMVSVWGGTWLLWQAKTRVIERWGIRIAAVLALASGKLLAQSVSLQNESISLRAERAASRHKRAVPPKPEQHHDGKSKHASPLRGVHNVIPFRKVD